MTIQWVYMNTLCDISNTLLVLHCTHYTPTRTITDSGLIGGVTKANTKYKVIRVTSSDDAILDCT